MLKSLIVSWGSQFSKCYLYVSPKYKPKYKQKFLNNYYVEALPLVTAFVKLQHSASLLHIWGIYGEGYIITCNILPSTGYYLNELRSFEIVEGFDCTFKESDHCDIWSSLLTRVYNSPSQPFSHPDTKIPSWKNNYDSWIYTVEVQNLTSKLIWRS